jgi:hypothetical protein
MEICREQNEQRCEEKIITFQATLLLFSQRLCT